MKKRYARILAATLSAAMVFTSSPVNFTGIDLGVIEAKADPATYTDVSLAAALKTAIDGVDRATYKKAPYDGVKTASSLANTVASTATITPADDNATNALQPIKARVVSPTDSTKQGTYTIEYTVETKNGETVNASAKYTDTVKIEARTAEYFSTDTSAVLELDTSGGTPKFTYSESYLKVSVGGEATTLSGFKVTDWTNVRKANYGQKVTGVEIQLEIPNYADAYDFSEAGDQVSYDGTKAILTRTIDITKQARPATDYSTLIATYTAANVTAEYTLGDSAVKIVYDGDVADNSVEVYTTDEDPTQYTTSDIGTKTTAVEVATVKEYDAKEYGLTADTTTVSAGGLTWTYKADKKFHAKIDLEVKAKSIKAKDIVWPTKLADGVTIKAGDTLADIKLEKTEYSDYGTFKLAKATGTKASAKDTVYNIVYTVKTGITIDPTDARELGISGQVVTKEAALEVSVAKVDLAMADVQVENGFTSAQAIYGKTYTQFYAALKGGAKDKCVYTLKGAKGSDKLPIGETTVTYEVKLNDTYKDDYTIEGKDSVTVTVKVKISKPEVVATVAGLSVVKIGTPTDMMNTPKKTLTATFTIGNQALNAINIGELSSAADLASVSYQWCNSKGEILNATSNTYVLDVTKMYTDEYYCVATLNFNDGLSAAKKAAWEEVAPGGKLTTNKKTVAVSNMDATITAAANEPFGSIKTNAILKVTPGTGYTVKSVEWYINDNKGNKVCDIADGTLTSAKVPTTLNAGTYTICAKITTTGEGKTDDIAVCEKTYTVSPIALTNAQFIPTQTDAQKKITYGQKVKEVKFTAPEDAEKLGTYEWVNGNTILDAGDNKVVTLRFIPNDDVLKNYTYAGAATFATNGYIDIAGVLVANVAKKELTVKADDITINVGDKIPAPTYTVEGLVGDDTAAALRIVAEAKVDETKVDTTKAGTYADVVTVTAKFDKTAANYVEDIKVVSGSVIVKTKADVAPSVKPTPAPVKQATAAAPKAAKAKATVKVGKKYTLKLKYAAGKKATVKKVTWKSSKKSVATVSSKGKVTAKKAGKTTIYATITFKDGSKKKVKFTVTVK